ncbi:MAG: M28 family peptidase [Anaerolineales bacterium]|jgi:aminopeptidase YwaD|nr:M28 family peptidase [Anaerolineales bacterium]
METELLYQKSVAYLKTLCQEIPGRSVGSEGNRQATGFFMQEVTALGWQTEVSELDVMDWEDGGATLYAANQTLNVFASPYSLGCSVQAPLINAASPEELEQREIAGKILLLHGDIAKEQLMPKNFVFYNPEEHRRIIALLEQTQPAAIISATGRNSALAGGAYPFPLIEDGDFDIPSVYTTEEEGQRLLSHVGKPAALQSRSTRIPAKAYNVIARKGKNRAERIVISAHIDAKKGTPGAIDNATGVITLLLLAALLKDYRGDRLLDLAPFNGEDYYAVPGQMDYIRKNQGDFKNILLNINIDGAGYKEGKAAFSFFNLPASLKSIADDVLAKYTGIVEGVQWPQGDHSIFVQQGCPAIAVSSQWLIEHMDNQEITHTPKDDIDVVDCRKVVEIAQALNWFIKQNK